jgi:hypothetical protein
LHPRGAKRKRSASLLIARGKADAERIHVERESWALVRPGREAAAAALPLHEDRVGRTDLHADARYEGQVGIVEVIWAPAEQECV